MEIIETSDHSFLCFSDLCQRLFLIDLRRKSLIRHYNHSADIMLMIDLKDNRTILFTDTDGKIFHWDYKRNTVKE